MISNDGLLGNIMTDKFVRFRYFCGIYSLVSIITMIGKYIIENVFFNFIYFVSLTRSRWEEAEVHAYEDLPDRL